MMANQLSLNLDIKSDASLNDFNAPGWSTLMDAVRQLHVGLIRQMYIYGSAATGKTHLLTAICESYIEMGRTAICLSLQDLVHTDTAVLNALESFDLIAIDNLHAIKSSRQWQEAVFHLMNRNLNRAGNANQAGVMDLSTNSQTGQLVFSANMPAGDLPFEMADLLTRLIQAPAFKIPDGHQIEDRRALLDSVLAKQGWQFDERILEHLLQEGPHRIGGMLNILYAIQPLFSNLNRTHVSKSVINEAIAMIDEKTLLAELEDIHSEAQADSLQKGGSANFNNMMFDF